MGNQEQIIKITSKDSLWLNEIWHIESLDYTAEYCHVTVYKWSNGRIIKKGDPILTHNRLFDQLSFIELPCSPCFIYNFLWNYPVLWANMAATA